MCDSFNLLTAKYQNTFPVSGILTISLPKSLQVIYTTESEISDVSVPEYGVNPFYYVLSMQQFS